jgi:hypothetical protein
MVSTLMVGGKAAIQATSGVQQSPHTRVTIHAAALAGPKKKKSASLWR